MVTNDVPSTSEANGDVVSAVSLANHEAYIARIDNTMAAIEDQKLTHDSRYHQLNVLRSNIAEGSVHIANGDGVGSTENGVPVADDSTNALNGQQLTQLRAQISLYKKLARNEAVPKQLLGQATGRKMDEHLPMAYEYPLDMGNGEKLPYDLMKVLNIHQQRTTTRVTTLPMPVGIDPQTVLKERENRIQNRIGLRIRELTDVPLDVSNNLRIKAEIEFRALRLLNYQMQMREEVLGYLKRDTTLKTALNPYAYRRTKRHTLREARITEKLERQQKVEQEKRRRQKHSELLTTIVHAVKEFREFHRNVQAKIAKQRKAVLQQLEKIEKERKKDELRNEKMRMMKLMEEDDVGYRQLLDEKKDKRLVFLLQQTDEYVESLTGLVRQHQQTEKKRKRDEKAEAKNMLKQQQQNGEGGEEISVVVRNCATGEILKGDAAPKMDEIEEWMDKNPGYEVISRDAADDSDDERSDDEHKPSAADTKDDEFEGLDEEQRNRQIIEKARNEKDEYDQKTKLQMESYYATAHRTKEKIVKQHSTLGGGNPNLQLKPYQLKGLEWMVSLYNNNLNGILADEMGLGKTVQTVALITYLMEVKKINGPYLIIVPLSTISNWQLELARWAPHVITITFKGDRDMRKRMEHSIRKGAFNVLLTTYDYVLKEKSILGKIRWKYMIIDEGHRMKNHNCKLTLTLNAYFLAQHRLLLTGTPLQNKLPELWALLNFLLPTIFSSCGTFEQWFNAPFATTGEKVELSHEETMLIIRRLHKVLRPFLLRRLKREVESQLPNKVEYIIKCDMSALQKMVYKHLRKGLLIDTKHAGGKALSNTIMHLRKLCNHPFLFQTIEEECKKFWAVQDITGEHLYRVCGKFELLDRMLPKLKATNHRILMFCQMTNLMNVLEDYMLYKGYQYLRLDGSTKHDERGQMLKDFNAPDSKYFLFMLSTRAGGLGLNLQTADTVIIYDSDWNPHQDMQAQDRAHRIGQTREVRVLRLVTTNSVEEKILAAARFKLNVDEKVIQAGKFDNRSTDEERKQMLQAIISAENDDDENDEVTEEEQLNLYLSRSEEEFALFQKMDAERLEEQGNRPRLIGKDDIPQSIKDQSQLFTEDEERVKEPPNVLNTITDGVRRKRKDVDYSQDLLTDKEWLDLIDSDGEDNGEPEPKRRKRKNQDGEASGSSEPPKRGRKKKKVVSAEEVAGDGNDSDNDGPPADTPSRGRKRRVVETDDALTTRLESGLNALLKHRTTDDRQLAEAFVKLPSRRQLPDYYEVIQRPMDLNRIKKKIQDGRYGSLDEMSADVNLLCRNAQEYNIEGSEIHNDSLLLNELWRQIHNGLAASAGSSGGGLFSSSAAAAIGGSHRVSRSSGDNTPTPPPSAHPPVRLSDGGAPPLIAHNASSTLKADDLDAQDSDDE